VAKYITYGIKTVEKWVTITYLPAMSKIEVLKVEGDGAKLGNLSCFST